MNVPISLKSTIDALKRRAKDKSRSALAARIPYSFLRAHALRDDPITILMYHTLGSSVDDHDSWTSVDVDEFRVQMRYLRRHYDVVTLEEALAGSGRRPRAVVTFDDGDVGLFRHLLPFVTEERLPVTVYVATGQIESGLPYWFDRVMNALNTEQPVTVDLRARGLGSWTVGRTRGIQNWLVISDVLESLKKCPPDVRETAAADIVDQTAKVRKRSSAALAPMSVSELRQLAAVSWIEIGAHTHCHGLLDQMPLNDAASSIERSALLLKEWTGRRVRHFAYPNGNSNAGLEKCVAALGFATAVAVGDSLCRRSVSRYALARIGIGRFDTGDRFKLRLLRRGDQ